VKSLFPWHVPAFNTIVSQSDRLPPGLLLVGGRGAGKLRFANHLARALLCTREAQGCGTCAQCGQFMLGHHPDFHVLTTRRALDTHGDSPIKGGERYFSGTGRAVTGRTITVDQVRALTGALALTAHGPGSKVVLIMTADDMNANAANALLKALEEPADNTFFLMACRAPTQIAATIRSRCMVVPLGAPPASVVRKHLADLKPSTQTLLDRAMTVGLDCPEIAETIILSETETETETGKGDGLGMEWTRAIKPGGDIRGEMLTKLDSEELGLVLPRVQQAICRQLRFQLMTVKDAELGELSRSSARSFRAYREIGRFLAATPGTVDDTLFVEHILTALE
jgi:DNA polymerase III delta' subunit